MGISEFIEGDLRRGNGDPGPALSRFQYPSNRELGSLASSLDPRHKVMGTSEQGQKALKE